MSMSDEIKRYFLVGDGGCNYMIVARDVEHAKQIMKGVEFTKEDGDSAPSDDPAFAHLEWREIAQERAATIQIQHDDGRPAPYPLTEADLGDWFSSEF
jgi:hypothetical protein